MAHGGARPGAGRKRGAKSQKTQEIALKAANDGITPIEVMLGAMRELWEAAQGEKDPEHRLKLAKSAAEAAKEAAPYVHPKIAAKSADDGGNGLSLQDPDSDIP